MATFWIGETSFPYTVLTFTATANSSEVFLLEIGDVVKVVTDFSGISSFTGRIVKISRTFGSMPKKQVNLWEITIVGWL